MGTITLVLAMTLPAAAQNRSDRAAAAKMRAYPTKYYELRTDLDGHAVAEAAARLTSMAEEYHRRTRGFSGSITKRLPFYLFSDETSYHAAGAPVGSAGIYDGKQLVALADPDRGDAVWGVVQHEAFHQFAHRCIRGNLPIWVNEGLAEYFQEGVWTGDGFVTGLVPPARLARIKAMIADGQLLSFEQMITMEHAVWNAMLSGRNYDQAWSMVHFLVHAEDGRYQDAFAKYINDLAAHRPPVLAFARRFGRDVGAFQQRYVEWWNSLAENPTAERYAEANVATLTSFLARATAQGVKFDDVEAFFAAAEAGELAAESEQWLPPSLLARAIEQARKVPPEAWSLGAGRLGPVLALTLPDGRALTGTFTLKGRKVLNVKMDTVRQAADQK